MRILIDESVHIDFAGEIADLDVSTVREEGWLSLRNSVMLRAAAARGLDVLITRDRAVSFQQNLDEIGIAVIVLAGVRNRVDDLRMLVSQIRSVLAYLRPGDSFEIRPLKGDAICDREIAA